MRVRVVCVRVRVRKRSRGERAREDSCVCASVCASTVRLRVACVRLLARLRVAESSQRSVWRALTWNGGEGKDEGKMVTRVCWEREEKSMVKGAKERMDGKREEGRSMDGEGEKILM